MKADSKRGEEVFSINGESGCYVGPVSGGHAVEPMYEHEDGEPHFGDLLVWREVFKTPPTERKHAEIAKLDAQITEKRALLNELHATSVAENTAVRERAARIKQHDKLRKLDDFLAGRITHFVLINGAQIHINSFKEALEKNQDRYDKSIRLLSLYGDSKGDIEWRINQYSDGSGSGELAIPCTSEEEARAHAQAALDAWVTLWRAGKEQYYVEYALASARRCGLSIGEDVAAAARAMAIKAAEQRVAEAQKQVELAEVNLMVAKEGQS